MHRIIGIYIEDYQVRVGSLIVAEDEVYYPAITDDTFRFSTTVANDQQSNASLSDLLSTALSAAIELHSGSVLVQSNTVSVATPGPMKNCGWPKIDNTDYGLINRYFMRRPHLNGANVSIEVQKCLRILMPSIKIDNIIINHDAAAHAFGSYFLRRQDKIIRGQSYESWPHVHVISNEGVGGAIINDGRLVQGRMHSELGHINVNRHRSDQNSDIFRCFAHEWQYCLEGMIGYESLVRRWGRSEVERIAEWENQDERLSVIASYFAQLCHTMTLAVAPRHIVFSGAPFSNPYLIDHIRKFTDALIKRISVDKPYPGYDEQESTDFIEACYMIEAGPLGACLLGSPAHTQRKVIQLRKEKEK